MGNIMKNIDDQRAFTDMGSALLVQKASGKYSLFLPVTDTPATGSAPDQQETTTTTSRRKTYTSARQDTPQKEFTFYPHRDNFRILKEYYGKKASFMQLNPDGTAWLFEGSVSYFQDAISTNSVAAAKLSITVSSAGELPIDNAYDLIEDTVTFTNAIDAVVTIKGTATHTFNVLTDPADATLKVTSETVGVATATEAEGKVTITGVKAGSTVVTITASKEGNASSTTTVLVIVE